MAKGKKQSGKTYVSKGERPNVSSSILSGMKVDRPSFQKWLNVVNAWQLGQKPKVSKDWGDPREAYFTFEGKRKR